MSHEEIFRISNDPSLSEAGGGHNQKGINFQRVWAVARMFELEDEGKDFLLLFESIQDIAEFDSERDPTSVSVYQVKKRDGGNWKWRDLTNLLELKTKKASQQARSDVMASPLGKLYASVRAFKKLTSNGAFVSNMGCELPLETGGTMATSLPTSLSKMKADHRNRLLEAFNTLHAAGEAGPDLSLLFVKKVALHPDAPEKALLGIAHAFLKSRSPHHANQAGSLVDALLAKVGPLGAKTDSCISFAELRRERGYSRAEFRQALVALEQIPDLVTIVSRWIDACSNSADFGLILQARTKIEVANIFRGKLVGFSDANNDALVAAFDTWLSEHPISNELEEDLRNVRSELSGKFPELRPEHFIARFLLRAAESCVDQI